MSQELVLVIDDNADQRAIACALLQFAGYRVQEADSAAAADVLVEKECPDLILLDLNMPATSGIDWLRDIGRRDCAPVTRIVAYTSFGDVYDSELRAHGVRAVIDKGATPKEFLDAIAESLGTPLSSIPASGDNGISQ